MDLQSFVHTTPDFPQPGIQYQDILPILASPEAFAACTEQLAAAMNQFGSVDKIVGLDARGFLFGAALALHCKLPFVALRKAGKLPGKTHQQTYDLEYGHATIELQKNAIQPQERVVLIDDVLATGGTLKAGCQLIEQARAHIVGCVVVLELTDLAGREQLCDYPLKTLLTA